MSFRCSMPSVAVLGAFVAALAAMSGSANAQSALSGCNPATGLGTNGQPCVELTPLDPNRISDVAPGADGGDRYGRLDTTTLGQTYACRQIDATTGGGLGGSLLIEDCGTPFSSAELGELKPFYGTTGAPAPAPAPVVAAPPPPPPTPVVYSPPPPTPVVAAPLPPAPALGFGGLGNAGLIAAGVGAAALVGIIAVAIDDDDDDSAAATTN